MKPRISIAAVTLFVLIGLIGRPERSLGQISNFLRITSNPTNYDTTLCGTSKCRQIRVENISNVPITINGVTPILEPITQDPGDPVTLPITLQPAQVDSFTLCYSPTDAPRRDTIPLLVQVDTGGVAQATDTLVLIGRSVAPQMTFNPSPMNFGNVNIGTQLCLPVTISNTGDAPLVISALNGVDQPFTTQTPSVVPIPPGGSQSLQVCYQPLFTGPARDTLVFTYNGCNSPDTLIVTGVGIQPTANIGPVLQIDSTVTNLDTTLCGTSKCRNIVFRNIGSSPLNVTAIDPLVAPFAAVLPQLPFVLQPNETRLFQVCYQPTDAPARDSQRVNVIADNRVSLTVATVVDVSGSMQANDATGVAKIVAANAGGRAFVGSLINNPALRIVDTGAVYEFANVTDFQRLTSYTTSIPVLQGAVPIVANGANTCINDAIIRVSADLANQNIPGRRVIVLLTDGIDGGCGVTQAQAIAAAVAAGVRIYTIGYGAAGSVNVAALTALAQGTGGFFSQTNSSQQLVQIFLQISDSLSRNIPTSFIVNGRAVRPILTLNPTSIDFDSIRVGQSLCRAITLSNTGDAPLVLTSVAGLAPPFTITNLALPTTIQPGGQVTADLCFTPSLLRTQRDTSLFPYVSCTPIQEAVALRGVGYDSLVVEVRDTTFGRPGSVVRIPVFLREPLPASYLVDSISVSLSYNKTMLFLDDSLPVVTTGTISQGGTVTGIDRVFEGPTSTVTIRLAGTTMSSATPNDTLMYARFLVLHGDSLITPVTVSNAVFADGNPKIGRVNPAFFVADSLCYQQLRLIDATRRIGGSLNRVVVRGVTAEIGMRIDNPGRARLTLHDGLGRLLAVIADDVLDTGDYDRFADMSRLPGGTYYLRLETSAGGDVKLIMLTR